jgi:hypothetical protein
MSNVRTIFEKDYDGRTALDIAIAKRVPDSIVVSMIELCLPVDPTTKQVVPFSLTIGMAIKNIFC